MVQSIGIAGGESNTREYPGHTTQKQHNKLIIVPKLMNYESIYVDETVRVPANRSSMTISKNFFAGKKSMMVFDKQVLVCSQWAQLDNSKHHFRLTM